MRALHYAQQICYSSKETLRFTYDMAVKYKDSPGVYCEMGCAAGAQIIAMACGAPNKTIYAFDSFEGIPLPSNKDDQMPGISKLSKAEQMALPDPGKQVLESSGATVVPVADFKNHLKESGIDVSMIFTVKGWFEKSIPNFLTVYDFISGALEGTIMYQPLSISILRLDGDLYNSTYVCLEHLFSKVIKGGCVIVDDYSLPGCRAACDEYFELIGYKPEYKFISDIAYFFK